MLNTSLKTLCLPKDEVRSSIEQQNSNTEDKRLGFNDSEEIFYEKDGAEVNLRVHHC